MSGDKKKKKSSTKKAVKEEEYVVEAILKKRIEGGKPEYLVKWKDWPHSSNTWEPVGNLDGCPELLEAFERKYNNANGSNDSEESGKEAPKKKPKLSGPANKNVDASSAYDSDVENDAVMTKSNSIDVDVLEECPKDRIPDELLGVVPINKIMTYLVKWKPMARNVSSATVEDDMNLVKGDVFKAAHPQVVISFYEKHIIWARDERVKEDLAKDAMMELDKSKAKQPDASVYPQNSPQVKINKTVPNNPADFSSSGEESDPDSDEASALEVDPTVST